MLSRLVHFENRASGMLLSRRLHTIVGVMRVGYVRRRSKGALERIGLRAECSHSNQARQTSLGRAHDKIGCEIRKKILTEDADNGSHDPRTSISSVVVTK